MTDPRKQINESLQKFGNQIANSKIFDLASNNNSIHNIINTPFFNFDFSKQKINLEAYEWLLTIPGQLNIKENLFKLLEGDFDNPTENKKVSHTIYRLSSSKKDHENIFSEREKIRDFLESLNSNKNIKNLISIGIGGSRLGPELLNQFQVKEGNLNVFFCSSYDLVELKNAICRCNQHETLVLVASKSFGTSEVLKNLSLITDWFEETDKVNLTDHLYAVSADTNAMESFGVKKENQFYIADSLGGRYSIWSSMSLPGFVNSDYESYLSFLEGASLADKYVSESEWKDNVAMIMALLSVWNTSALGINNHGIFTYNYNLRSFMLYVAQLSMESNGKSINADSVISPLATSPLIWGGYGVDSQHSTFQWMMQGKTYTSCDFIGLNDQSDESKGSYQMLLSQVLAMTFGEINEIESFKSVRGNNPCSVIQLHSLDLKTLGFLIAIYEHKVFFEGLILGINSFDQWGVQLGKRLTLNSQEDSEFLSSYYSPELLPRS